MANVCPICITIISPCIVPGPCRAGAWGVTGCWVGAGVLALVGAGPGFFLELSIGFYFSLSLGISLGIFDPVFIGCSSGGEGGCHSTSTRGPLLPAVASPTCSYSHIGTPVGFQYVRCLAYIFQAAFLQFESPLILYGFLALPLYLVGMVRGAVLY